MSQGFRNVSYSMQSSTQVSWRMVWMENGEIIWVDDAFPDDIMDILVDEDFDEGNMELELDPLDDSDDENIDD